MGGKIPHVGIWPDLWGSNLCVGVLDLFQYQVLSLLLIQNTATLAGSQLQKAWDLG